MAISRAARSAAVFVPLLLAPLAVSGGCSTSPGGIGTNTGSVGEAGSASVTSGGGAAPTGSAASGSGAPSTVTGGSSAGGLGGAGTPPLGAGGGTGGLANPGANGGSAGARAGATSSTGGEDGAGGSNGTSNGSAGNDTLGGGGAGGVSPSGGSGGEPNGGGASGGPSTSELADAYPCNSDASAYDVVVTGSGSSWSVAGGSGAAQSYTDLAAALGGAYGRLTANRTTKETVLVEGDGTIDASVQLKLPSYIVLNLCGTIEVTGTAAGSDRSPLYARDRTDIDIPHAHITGNPQYGMFFRSVSRLHLGEILLEQNRDNSGIGIRIDNNPTNGAGSPRVTDIRIDHATGVGTGSHVVETYGVDGLVVGRVDGTDTGECGLLLNDTANAEVGVVHCENCAAGTGYAAFRIANDAGKIGDAWPAGNIHVGEVYARDGGRGIFSVSGSGGLTIDRIDLADTGNNAILLQNCYNTTIAAEGGTVTNGDVVLSNDTDNTNAGTYEASSDVLLSHLTLSNATVSEAWCDLGDRGNRAEDITGGSVDMCF